MKEIDLLVLKEIEQIQTELAVFWNIMEKDLPDTHELAQLGRQILFNAFKLNYPHIREYLLKEGKRIGVEDYKLKNGIC